MLACAFVARLKRVACAHVCPLLDPALSTMHTQVARICSHSHAQWIIPARNSWASKPKG